jgi:hypothetical protein
VLVSVFRCPRTAAAAGGRARVEPNGCCPISGQPRCAVNSTLRGRSSWKHVQFALSNILNQQKKF